MGKKAKLEVTGETHKWRVGKKASSAKAARNFPALGDSRRGGQKCPETASYQSRVTWGEPAMHMA